VQLGTDQQEESTDTTEHGITERIIDDSNRDRFGEKQVGFNVLLLKSSPLLITITWIVAPLVGFALFASLWNPGVIRTICFALLSIKMMTSAACSLSTFESKTF